MKFGTQNKLGMLIMNVVKPVYNGHLCFLKSVRYNQVSTI